MTPLQGIAMGLVIVLVDAQTGRPTRITPEMRAAWEPYVGESIVYAHR